MKTEQLFLAVKDDTHIVCKSKVMLGDVVGLSRGQVDRFLSSGVELTKTGYKVRLIEYRKDSKTRI